MHFGNPTEHQKMCFTRVLQVGVTALPHMYIHVCFSVLPMNAAQCLPNTCEKCLSTTIGTTALFSLSVFGFDIFKQTYCFLASDVDASYGHSQWYAMHALICSNIMKATAALLNSYEQATQTQDPKQTIRLAERRKAVRCKKRLNCTYS